MSKAHEPGGSYSGHGQPRRRKMSWRRFEAARRKKLPPFVPDFHGLEKRMMPATFVVTNPGDSGAGSLRQEILDSNAASGSNRIDFNIPSGPYTITPLSALPAITVSVIIDGTSQPGYAGTPLIELDGASAGSNVNGLSLFASTGGDVAGLAINRFSANGILIAGEGWNVDSCYIGTDTTGKIAEANGGAGVEISGTGNTIGAATSSPGTGPGNVISGNTGSGILIDDSSGNLVAGNLIGTDATGSVALGNAGEGVQVLGSSGNTIGAGITSTRNIISSNTGDGIELSGAGTSGNVIAGNYIGTASSGTSALPNYAGVKIVSGASGNLIGSNGDGTNDTLERNILSGNLFAGIWITDAGTSNNTVAGNFIGTDVSGNSSIANGSAMEQVTAGGFTISGGIVIQNGASSNLVGTSGQSADDVGERNVISGNQNDGIDIYQAGTIGNVVAGNFIGLSAAGTTTLPNTGDGVFLAQTASNVIGVNLAYGPENADQGNVISGDGYEGIEIAAANNNVVAGNEIGTDPTGQTAMPNPYGIVLEDASSGNLIGTSGQNGANDAIERNLISGNVHAGVLLGTNVLGGFNDNPPSSNVVAGNKIGTNAAGTAALGNGGDGVEIYDGSTGNTVGVNTAFGPESADQRNIISGNSLSGIEITGAGSGGNTVAGNEVGTNAAGAAAVPNHAGVEIDSGASGNLIGTNGDGTSDALERNIVSGNSLVGVWITGSGTNNNVVAGNYVGTDVTGTLAVPNGTSPINVATTDLTSVGIAIEAGASGNRVGTNGTDADTAGERNVISGNNSDGVEIGGNGSSGNLVAGNYIGLIASGTAALGNNQAGVLLLTGPTANTIGGVTAALRNVIGGNGHRGIFISTAANSTTPTTHNVIAGNYIGTDATGLAPMTNHADDAVSINLSPANIIGGTVAGAGNVLSAAGDSGIFIYGDSRAGRLPLRPAR